MSKVTWQERAVALGWQAIHYDRGLRWWLGTPPGVEPPLCCRIPAHLLDRYYTEYDAPSEREAQAT